MDVSLILRKFRKTLASASVLALLSTLVVSTSGVANAASFTDIAGHWAESYIEELTPSIFDDGATFRPNDAMNRAEFSKVIVEAAGFTQVNPATPTFTDVPANAWFYGYVETAKQFGVVNGDTDPDTGDLLGTFRPADNVNRTEAAKMIVNGIGLNPVAGSSPFSDVPAWGQEFVNTLYSYCIVDGVSSSQYDAGRDVTRAEIAKMISLAQKASDPNCRTTGGDGDGDGDGDVTPGGEGTLEVELSSMSPASASIPKNGVVFYTAVDFTAKGAAVKLNGFTITRFGGLGDRDSFDNVWVVDNETKLRVGNVRTINRDDQAAIDFGSNPIEIPQGATVTLWLAAKMNTTTTGEENALGINAAADVKSSAATIDGSFAVKGAMHKIENIDAGTLEIENLDTSGDIEVGQTETLLKATFENKDTRDKDYVLESMVVKNDGTEDIADVLDPETIVVKIGSTVVSKSVTLVGEHLFIVFDPAKSIIADGEDRTVELTADLIAGEDGRTIKLVIEEESDVYARINAADAPFGVDIQTKTPTQTDIEDYPFGTYTIDAGEFTVRRHPETPGSNVFIPTDEATPVLVFTMRATAPVLVKDVDVRVTAKEANGTAMNDTNLTDTTSLSGKLPANNLEVSVAGANSTEASSPIVAINATNGEYRYQVENIDAEVVGEVKSTVTAEFEGGVAVKDESYRFEVQAGEMKIDRNTLSDDSTLIGGDKTGTARSEFLTLNDEELDVALLGPQDETYVSGSSDVQAFCFSLKANNSGGEVKVDDITISRKTSSEVTKDELQTLSLLDDAGNVLDDVNTFDTNGDAKFENLDSDIILQPNQQKDYCLEIGSVDQNTHAKDGIDANSTADLQMEIKVGGIIARDGDDRSVSTITGLALDSGFIRFAPTGTLSLTVNQSYAPSKIIAAGSTAGNTKEVVVGVEAVAIDDDIYIDEIVFENDLDDDTSTATQPNADEDNIGTALQRVELFDLVSKEVLATANAKFVSSDAYPSGEDRMVAKFDSMNNQLLVPKGDSREFGVRIETLGIDTLTKSGVQVQLQPVHPAHLGVVATSKSSGSKLGLASITLDLGTNDDSNIANDNNVGDLFVIRRSAPKFHLVNSSQAAPGGGAKGVVARFDVEPLVDNVNIARFTARANTKNAAYSTTVGDWEVYSADQDGGQCPSNLDSSTYKRTVTVSTVANAGDNATSQDRYFFFNFADNGDPITKGKKRCYAVKAPVVAAGADDATSRTASLTFVEDSTIGAVDKDSAGDHQSADNTSVAGVDAIGHFLIWSDNPTGSRAAYADNAWVNGFKVEGLPMSPINVTGL